MRHFFLSQAPVSNRAVIGGDQGHHLARVLRMQPGEEVVVTDPDGRTFLSRIEKVDSDRVSLLILDRIQGTAEPCVKVSVYQAVIKGDHFDYAVQKSVETGAFRIVPFLSERCVKRPKSPEKFVERAQRIALEAAKQCGRALIPRVAPIESFDDVLAGVRAEQSILAYEREKGSSLKDVLAEGCPPALNVLIGPEGGFTEAEARALMEAGAQSVGLGPRILRSETAAPYVLAQINYACCQ